MATVSKSPQAKLPPITSNTHKNLPPKNQKQIENLSGPTYTLPDNQGTLMKYGLPPPNLLKPYNDTKAGTMDTWPAHATNQSGGHAYAVVLTRDKHLKVTTEDGTGAAGMVPKPKFLEQLEKYLELELKTLGVPDIHPSELRLQAHREVFEYLIEDFKTYRPLLSAIKNEYEILLAYYREQLQQIAPLKQMLVTVSEQCDQKVMALREQEKQEIVDLKKENKTLYKRIDELRQDQAGLQTQVEKLQEELAAEYLRYRDECDARKMLVADINDLRYQQEDSTTQQTMEDLEEEPIDPVTLSIALKKAREDEAAASQRLNEMVANYGDVIPRRDFEALQKVKDELEGQLDVKDDDFQKLKSEHDILLAEHKNILQQRDDYYLESENLRRNATPRPDWTKCADFIAGGNARWQELSVDRTSDQLVDVLLQEIAGGNDGESTVAEFFDGLGTGPEIPSFLRHEGKVRNRRLGKRDTALLIKDIWREKAANDAERTDGTREKIGDFMKKYLDRRFGIELMVVEWAYNLHDASERYSHDERIGMFSKIINGNADEDLYHSNLQLIALLLNHMTKFDMERGNSGELNKEDFTEALREFFPSRDQENIQELVKCAELELDAKDAETITYQNLFMEDDEGKTGVFLDEVTKQQTNERLQYVEEIKAELPDSVVLSVEDLKKAITIADPEIETPDMDRYLSWGFKCDRENLDKAEPMETSELIERLNNGNLKRIGPK